MKARDGARDALRRVRGPARRVRRSPAFRWSAVVTLALLGAWLGILAAGAVTAQVGPVEARLSLRPALSGQTRLQVPPLGSVTLDTHRAPVVLEAVVESVDPVAARRLVSDPAAIAGLEVGVVSDVRQAVRALALRTLLAGTAGAAIAVLLVVRRPRRAAVGAGVAVSVLVVTGGAAAATFDPTSLAQPRYDGLLTMAPTVVGSAESIVGNVGRYGQQLAKLVTNVSQLYNATSTLPAFQPAPGTVRVLSVSDIHLNPIAFDLITSVSEQFQADFVVDSGDLTDHGSAPEDRFAALIARVGRPYVFVRGNHDSAGTLAAVARQPNAVVLRDGQSVELEGLRVAGIGDPRFTPDKSTRGADTPESVLASGSRLAEEARASDVAGEPVDIAVVHDPAAGEPLDGVVPLVLAGHGHAREVRSLEAGTVLFEQGSTGGAGLRGLEGESPTPIQMSVLYFDRDTGALQAWDDIDMGGLGLTSASIERHVVDGRIEAAVNPDALPGPARTPSP